MKALLVIDAQNAIVEFKYFQQELTNMENIIQDFKEAAAPVIFIRNINDEASSPFYKKSPSSELHHSLKEHADIIVEKKTPSAFFQTELSENLASLGIDHLFITGFNTEFCCQFSAIAAYDRGYKGLLWKMLLEL